MDLALFYGRNLHIVAVEILEIGIRVMRTQKRISFEFNVCDRKDTVLPVLRAIAVVDGLVGEVCIRRFQNTGQSPERFVKAVFKAEPEKFRGGSHGVIMLVVQDGIAPGYSAGDLLGKAAGDARVRNHREDIYIEALLVIGGKVITSFYIEGVQVSYLAYRFLGRFCFRCLEDKVGGKLLRGGTLELFQSLCGHGNIDIVIPGNESFVAHRSENGPSVQPVINVVLPANGIDFFEDIQLFQLAFAQLLFLVFFEIFIFHFLLIDATKLRLIWKKQAKILAFCCIFAAMNIAIILSGGVGCRMGRNIPKQYLVVGGKPVIRYCVETFCEDALIDEIVICLAEEWKAFVQEALKDILTEKTVLYSVPGRTRQLTIYNALKMLDDRGTGDEDVVVIHDAARPLVSRELIDACLEENRRCDGVLPVIPVKDTIYRSNDGLHINALLDRKTLFAGQAPESFVFGKYLRIHEEMPEDEIEKINGSSEIAQKAGLDVHLIPGDSMNFKITTPDDLSSFRTIIMDH